MLELKEIFEKFFKSCKDNYICISNYSYDNSLWNFTLSEYHLKIDSDNSLIFHINDEECILAYNDELDCTPIEFFNIWLINEIREIYTIKPMDKDKFITEHEVLKW